MTEITQAQIEIWKRDSEILDRVKKAVETDLNKPWYTEEFIKLIGGDKKLRTWHLESIIEFIDTRRNNNVP